MRPRIFFLLFVLSNAHGQIMKSPKAESEALMNASMPIAVQMLEVHGEFHPYGHALDNAGKFISISATDGAEQTSSKDLISLLKYGLREGANAGKYKATALVYDVRILLPNSATKSDAIAISLNHQNNYAVIVFYPYQIREGKLHLGEMLSKQEENTFLLKNNNDWIRYKG